MARKVVPRNAVGRAGSASGGPAAAGATSRPEPEGTGDATESQAAVEKAAPAGNGGQGGAAAPLAEGDAAPGFDLATGDGGRIGLAGLAGKTIVLYFYPKDDTSGCTREALDFTRLADDLRAVGAVVIGVSPDSADSHRRFAGKHGLAVTLAANPDKAACTAYGVWVEKSMYGRKYMGVERATFLIDGQGRLARIWRKVKVPGHAAAVLEAVRALPRSA
jgi:peroxiredoxin Q/BCP